jgi:NAD(P)-dependent dehydrogenase (short-subunit alcohol dehydrogenase family)
VAPAFIDTPGTSAGREGLDATVRDELITMMGEAKPLGRIGVPDDVARVVLRERSCLADDREHARRRCR